jgi:hypothetical protein
MAEIRADRRHGNAAATNVNPESAQTLNVADGRPADTLELAYTFARPRTVG